MRRIKLFFLLTALLAIAQGTWAGTKTFTSFVKGDNIQSPVTVKCWQVSANRVLMSMPVEISVSAGYTITSVEFRVYSAYDNSYDINASPGTISNKRPTAGTTVTVSNVNNTSTTLQSYGNYIADQIQVNYAPVNYTISYTLNGGSISGSYPTSYNIETNTFTLKNPTRSGYTFTGWTRSNGSTKQTSVSIAKGSTGNKSYTANWQVNQASVTTAPTAKTGLTYNGSAKALVNAGVASNGTMYYKVGSGSWSTSIPTATNAGTYTVQYYAKGTGGASDSGTGSVQVTIAKANPTVTAPTAKSGLKYTGSAQALVNAGSTTGGTMQYKVGSGSWGTSIPTGTDVGTYTVYYQVVGNTNYNGNSGSNFQVTIAQSDQQKADAVIAQINAIGSPITASSQTAISSARTAYNALTAEQKALVTNYTTLTNAEAALAVVNLINAIGSPITAASQTAIDAARNAYDNLTDDQKALVGNLSALIDAEAALAVVNQIAAIGEVTLSSGSTIDAARNAYNNLTGDQQALVGNYATLTAAEAAYNTLVADHAAADAVIDKINAIGSPITATSQTAIEDARAAYNALTDTQKGYVTNDSELTAAEAALAAVNLINAIDDPVTASSQTAIDAARNAYDALSNDQKALVGNISALTDAEAALAVVNLINAIGSPITAASQTAIDAARNAYDNLTDDQKALVGNLSALIDAEAALAVVNQIAAIGEVTLSSGSTIADVRTAYDALTGDQQALVGNYATLTAAEAAYNTLVTDHAAADAVIAQINAIGSPITATSQTAIEDAHAAYDALTDTQKGYVTNYSELTDAEAALAVVNLINAIDNPVVYTNECHQEILDARTAYDALSDEQKALVDATTLQVLTDAEAAYAASEADHNAANAVIDLINAIDNPVVYTDACHQEILDAREAYDNLTQAQKDLIDASTLQKLTDAEDAYASLNVAITAKPDPVNAGVYYSTFYDGSRQLQLPANVEAYTATVSGDKMLLKKVAVPGDILPAATAVVLRASQADFTLTPSAASPVSVENNALRGTDVNMEVPSEHCYVLSGADGFVGFYPLSAPYTLTAHKAYIDLDNLPGGPSSAPRRLRFVFSEEQTATGMENVQNEETKAQKVMIDGVMYIIRGEHMYDAQGQIVK